MLRKIIHQSFDNHQESLFHLQINRLKCVSEQANLLKLLGLLHHIVWHCTLPILPFLFSSFEVTSELTTFPKRTGSEQMEMIQDSGLNKRKANVTTKANQ